MKMAANSIIYRCLITLAAIAIVVEARSVEKIRFHEKVDETWFDAHATFYGDMGGAETMSKYILTRTIYTLKLL